MGNKNKILVSYLMVIITFFSVVFYSFFFQKKQLVCGTPDISCGVGNNIEYKDGRILFKSLCASCHKLNKKLIGPALGGLQMDSILFFKYLTLDENTAIKNRYHKSYLPQLTVENINDIHKYLKD